MYSVILVILSCLHVESGNVAMDNEGITVVYGDVCLRKKQRRKRQKLLVIEQLYDFAKNTTLHGLRYITDRELHNVEKIFWCVTFIISTILCFCLMHNVWIKWKTSPVIVTVSEELVPVGEIPFPSITICPQMKSMVPYYNYTHEAIYLRKEMAKASYKFNESHLNNRVTLFEDISMVCDNSDYLSGSELPVYSERNVADFSVAQNIIKVSPKKNDVLAICRWHSRDIDCRELFREVLTQEGLCFNMNALAAEELVREENLNYTAINTQTRSKGWTLAGGYEGNDETQFPRRGRENGAMPDLVVFLVENTERKDKLCNIVNTGFKVYIHHPTDFPRSSLFYYGVTHQHVSSMALSYTILNTPDELRHYPADLRKCFFSDERHLQNFRIYTADNCRLECMTNYTFELCGCVAFYMPHTETSKICTYNKFRCMREAQEHMAQGTLSVEGFKECNCLPACNNIDYDAEIYKTEFNIKDLINFYDYGSNNTIKMQFSKLDVYFKKPRFVSMRRSELFGTTDFLANCGGLLGLFLGFSFLSIVEIFYFITLRVWCTLKRDLDEERRIKKLQAKKIVDDTFKAISLPVNTISK